MLDWLIAMHRKRVVGRIVEGAQLPPYGGNYLVAIWDVAQIAAVGGDVSRLPRRYAELERLQGKTPSWDKYIDNGREVDRDGQAMDQLIAGPSQLRYLLRQEGEDLVAAQAIANRWREAGGTHHSVLTMGRGFTTVQQHLEHLAAVKDAMG